MLRLAIRRDAVKEAKDKSWLTPLLIAVQESHSHVECSPVIEAIEALLDEGCDSKAKDKEGWTILHHAARSAATSHILPKSDAIAKSVLELLVNRLPRAALEVKDKDGHTPLLRIAGSGNAETVTMLLDTGADIHARNIAGRSALYLAMSKKPDIIKYANVIKVLVDRGAVVQENEFAKDEYERFKYLFPKPDTASARRLSESARRKSESKSSGHQMERTSTSGSSHASRSIPEEESAVDGKKPRKRSGLTWPFK